MAGERPNLKVATMHAVSAAGMMAASFIFCLSALEHDREAMYAETVAEGFEAQDSPQADVWEDRAEAEQEERNKLFLVAGALLVSSAFMGAANKLNMAPRKS